MIAFRKANPALRPIGIPERAATRSAADILISRGMESSLGNRTGVFRADRSPLCFAAAMARRLAVRRISYTAPSTWYYEPLSSRFPYCPRVWHGVVLRTHRSLRPTISPSPAKSSSHWQEAALHQRPNDCDLRRTINTPVVFPDFSIRASRTAPLKKEGLD